MNFERSAGAMLDRTKRLRTIIETTVPNNRPEFVEALGIVAFIEGMATGLSAFKDAAPVLEKPQRASRRNLTP